MGPHRFLSDPSCTSALVKDPGQTSEASQYRLQKCCPRAQHSEGSDGQHDVEAQFHGFSTHCLRFTLRVATAHARLVSGWLLASTGRESNPLDHGQGFSLQLVSTFIPPDQAWPVASWAHARRKFRDSLKSNKHMAAAALRPIQRLFWIERAITARAAAKELNLADLAELRLEVRGRLSRRMLKETYEVIFALDEDPKVTSGSQLGKAVKYAINQRGPLTALLRHGEIPIHNNDTERDLRHVVTGRKNWLIFGSQRGGEVAGRLYSLVMSSKLAGINVSDYLEDALSLISTTPASEIAMLTPWGWKAAQAAATSDPGA